MAWPGEDEHRQLLAVAADLVRELADLGSRFAYGDVTYAQHDVYANRGRSLSRYLTVALSAVRADLYPPAFAMLRSALEHTLIDHLVFLGRRYIRVFEQVDEATWADWQQRRDNGTDFHAVVSWNRTSKGRVEITFEGLRSEPDADGRTIEIGVHYFLLEEYSPYFGPPGVQAQFDDGLIGEAQRVEFAKNNRDLYHMYLSWESIKKSLVSNGFATDQSIHMLDVHYRFLSAFVHPNTDVVSLAHGRNGMWRDNYDHFSSELALLYLVALAVEELRHFQAAASREPVVGLKGWDEVERLCERAWQLCSHLWFPGHDPHMYDRVHEANSRAFRELREGRRGPVIDPEAIPIDEIRYYHDPLQRLIRLHSSAHEMMTGLVYQSPWPRDDARFR